MTHFSETAGAWGKLTFEVRAYLCEMFVGWAIRVAPDGYVPSYIKACVDAYKHQGAFAKVAQRQGQRG